MFSKLQVQTIALETSHDEALRLIIEIVASHGFEITEVTDLAALVGQLTKNGSVRKSTVVQMHKPAMLLGSALLDNALTLLLPLRMLLRETDEGLCEVHLPRWEVVRDSERGSAAYCMDVLYTRAVGTIAACLQQSSAVNDSTAEYQKL